jgi:hypothetical protein
MKKPKKIYNENDFRQLFHAVAEEQGWHVDHIESPLTSPGIVDLILSRNNLSLWLEFKVWRNGIHMLPSQKRWHRARVEANCMASVVCFIDGGIYVTPGGTAVDLMPTDCLWYSGFRFELAEIPAMLAGVEGESHVGISVSL